MKRNKGANKQVKARIKMLREEMNKLPEYVLQEIRSYPTEIEQCYMNLADIGNLREHEMSIR